MAKKTASKAKPLVKAKVVKKNPAKAVVKKESSVKKTVARKAPALEIKRVVKAQPQAKAIEKSTVVRDAPKPGVRLAKKVQTAEGWKRDQIKLHRIKKTKE